MKILVTGARGFVGKKLVAYLESIWDGKNRVHKIQGVDNPADLFLRYEQYYRGSGSSLCRL